MRYLSEIKPLVLVISHVIPYPPAAGNEIRILKMLNWLKQKGFSIILLFNHSQLPSEGRPELERLFSHVHFIGDDYGCELKPLPKQPWKLSETVSALLGDSAPHRLLFGQDRQSKIKSDGVKKWLASDRLIQITEFLCRKYTPCAVLGEYIFTAPCLDVVPNGILKIIDTHDMFSRKKEQVLKYGIEDPLPCTACEERNYLLKADVIIAIQSNEARMFRNLVMGRDVITVGIDFDVVPEIDNGDVVPGRILVVGSDNPLNRHGLRQFHDHAWPAICACVPGATLRVIGKLANHLQADDERVQLAGWVEDLDLEYRQATVVVNPTVAGTGLKIKSVEALCKGKALVATTNSVEGIEHEGSAPYVVCGDWSSFADAVVRLLTSGEEREFLQRRALKYARDNFSSEKIYAPLGKKLNLFLHGHD
jgi:glycosyltransferase involved in cell wall biosynthesis